MAVVGSSFLSGSTGAIIPLGLRASSATLWAMTILRPVLGFEFCYPNFTVFGPQLVYWMSPYSVLPDTILAYYFLHFSD